MEQGRYQELLARLPLVGLLAAERELCWINERCASAAQVLPTLPLGRADVDDAEARLARFAPFLRRAFPETEGDGGRIESPLSETDALRRALELPGRLFLKRDSDLPIAGSVKARGGIYEVLQHTEELAMAAGLLREEDDYSRLCDLRDFFAQYSIHVGSTGNLGLSIGIMSAVIGYRVSVHMSADARAWKKALLRSYGVQVVEYDADYSYAVEQGRKCAQSDEKGYFVDDENSKTLFLGYATAARRLKEQLRAQGVTVDAGRPLFVYLPCGVGGAPGGICFGLRQEFGDDVYPFFVEPTRAPCMLLGLVTGEQDRVCVQDVGLSGLTAADGLAVGRPSRFVGRMVERLVQGEFTVRDAALYDYLRLLERTEGLFIEPSACAALEGPAKIMAQADFLSRSGLAGKMANAVHVAWATGGRLVPEEERQRYLATYLES